MGRGFTEFFFFFFTGFLRLGIVYRVHSYVSTSLSIGFRLNCIEVYWVLPGFSTGFPQIFGSIFLKRVLIDIYRVLLGFIVGGRRFEHFDAYFLFYRELPGFNSVLGGFVSRGYLVLPSFPL